MSKLGVRLPLLEGMVVLLLLVVEGDKDVLLLLEEDLAAGPRGFAAGVKEGVLAGVGGGWRECFSAITCRVSTFAKSFRRLSLADLNPFTT